MATPHLRQTASGPPPFSASLEWGTGYEVLLALSMFTGDERQDSYDVGKAWFVKARAAASPQLVKALRALLGADVPRWFLMLGMVHEAGGARDVARLLSHLRGSRPDEVLTALIGGRLPALRTREGRTLVKSALAGDSKAVLGVAERSHAGNPALIRRLIQRGATEVKQLTLEVIDRFDHDLFVPMVDNAAALEADVKIKTKAARRMSAHQLVDFATGGITHEGDAGHGRGFLGPPHANRPCVPISDCDSTKVICYRTTRSAEAAGGEPDRDLVLVYRALGDETRLRLLRELAAGA